MALINPPAAEQERTPEQTPAVAPATEAPKATLKHVLKKSLFVQNKGPYPLAEPFTFQNFPPEQATETPEITPWLQAQIDAGLFEIVE